MALGRKSEIFHREAKLKKRFVTDIEKYRFKERMTVENFEVVLEKKQRESTLTFQVRVGKLLVWDLSGEILTIICGQN